MSAITTIWREDNKIKRPLLYLAGGLVLGETMALWMTEERKLIPMAAMLLLLFVAFFRRSVRKEAKGGSAMLPFLPAGSVLAVCFGLLLGFFAMEWDTAAFFREEAALRSLEGDTLKAEGRICQIEPTALGYRIALSDVAICPYKTDKREESDIKTYRFRRIFCHVKEKEGLEIGKILTMSGEGKLPGAARNPGGFDYRLYCRSRGVGGVVYAGEILSVSGEKRLLADGLYRLREFLSARLGELAPEQDAGLLRAVLLGDRTELPDSVYEEYRRNGISHLLAISGLHISMIGLSLWKSFRKLGVGLGTSGCLSVSFLLFYGAMTGFSPSVVRAVCMAALSFLACALGRTYDLPSALGVSGIFILLFHPYQLTQAGFQLSFLAVGAVFFPGECLRKCLGKQETANTLPVSLSIQLATAPVILFHSFEIPVYGLLLNLIVIPLMAYVVLSGILGLSISFLHRTVGAALFGGAHYVLAFYRGLCGLADKLPQSVLLLGRPALWQVALYYGCLIAGGVGLAQPRDRRKSLLLAAAIWTCGFLFLIPVRGEGLSVTFLDVGQGDAIYLETDGHGILVDCGSQGGNPVGERCLLPFLKSRGISRLDAVAVSHGDLDHISGIRFLLEENPGISIGMLILPRAGHGPVYEELKKLSEERGIPVALMERGAAFPVSLGETLAIRCLSPDGNLITDDRNEESLVLEVRYGHFSMLLTGDVGEQGEAAMIEAGEIRPVTVLKAAHHGSASSTGEAFFKASAPERVVFSYGKGNRYGHPAKQVVERCRKAGASIYRTAELGAVQIWTDGVRIRMGGFLAPY